MKIIEYNYLPEEARIIRGLVFMNEQGFKDEFDEIDITAKHIVLYEEEQPISTCRIYFNCDKQSFVIGRVAVLREWRGKNIGARIIKAAEDNIKQAGGKTVMLSGQLRVTVFYEKLGYAMKGESFLEEGCPHIWMIKTLE